MPSKYGLIEVTNNEFMIRLATPDDAKDVFVWRNDEITRLMSRQIDKIDLETHMAWFGSTLKRVDRTLFIGMNVSHKAGMVRFDRMDDLEEWEVSIAVAPELRGLGYGKRLLAGAVSEFLAMEPSAKISAEVKRNNLASQKIFESLGFDLVPNNNPDIFRYRLPHIITFE